MLKGKWKPGTSLNARDEGSGGADGIVLPLNLVGSGIYDVAYTLPVKFGSRNQQFSLQIDTGSSDLWVASTSCSSQSCSQTNGRLYNPSGSTATGVQFHIDYLQGSASGPVVWDSVTVGSYTIDTQAFAAVSIVQNEPLTPDFTGILGLALPLNSIIATSLPPVTTNDADGAALASNLFSITPSTSAPSPFLSLSLSRPGSDQIPSLLGIGRHPSSLVTNPSNIHYSTVVTDKSGILFWKANIRAITVYVNGQPQHISIGRSVTGGVFPTAVLDSGVPLILTTSTIANGIYGAIGISPASDGLYYVPCKTPLNLTMTIDSRPEIPLHPLDLTANPPEDNMSEFCIGLIQTADNQLSQPQSTIGDMILGVPFLRNVYTVMAYSAPSPNGTFPLNQSLTTHINPRLGLMSLTDPTRALEEFNTVRVLNQPLTNTTAGMNGTKTVSIGGAKLSVGVAVLLGLMTFIGLCGFLFLARYLLMRRRFHKSGTTGSEEGVGFMDQKAAYQLVKKESTSVGVLSEDQLRQMRYDAYKRNTVSTASSDRTRVESLSFGKKSGIEDDFDFRIKNASAEDLHDVWDPLTALDWGGDTFVATRRRQRNRSDASSVLPHNSTSSSPERSIDSHHRQLSDLRRIIPSQHQPQLSVDIPLLSAQHQPQRSVDIPLLSAQPSLQPPLTNGGVTNETSALALDGSHREDSSTQPPLPSDCFYLGHRNEIHGPLSALETPHSLYPDVLSYPDAPTVPPLDASEADELGIVNEISMAGVGTASRTNKISRDSALLNRDSLFDART